MPHSSGGGSHGGGSHGGSGSSGPRVSSHYFPGARRYVRHYHSGAPDQYVYASSKPQKTSLSSVIAITIMGVIFTGISSFAIITDFPRSLKPVYDDAPMVYDDIGVIKDDDALLKEFKEYYYLTGICPVIYTTYDEAWNDTYVDLESYTFNKYLGEFDDEQHWLFVYSIPEYQIDGVHDGSIKVADYSWEAVQGDETDVLISENMIGKFADRVQDNLEDGKDPGTAFGKAFEYAYDYADSKLNPKSVSRYLSIFGSFFPVLFVAGFFTLMILLMFKSYKKDKDIEYEEVPLDCDPVAAAPGNGSHNKEVRYELSPSSPPKVKLMAVLFMIPFFIAGIIILAAGIGMNASNNGSSGAALIVFGVIWLVVLVLFAAKIIARFFKDRKSGDSEPSKVKSDYSSASNDPDDEDYKRMKRQGYE